MRITVIQARAGHADRGDWRWITAHKQNQTAGSTS
jgi:hypothetical protein